jgi:hypothetical protein
MSEPLAKVTGATYAIRHELKAMGGRWDPDLKCWWVPEDRAAEARRLIRHVPNDYRSPFKPDWEDR